MSITFYACAESVMRNVKSSKKFKLKCNFLCIHAKHLWSSTAAYRQLEAIYFVIVVTFKSVGVIKVLTVERFGIVFLALPLFQD